MNGTSQAGGVRSSGKEKADTKKKKSDPAKVTGDRKPEGKAGNGLVEKDSQVKAHRSGPKDTGKDGNKKKRR